MIKKENSWMFSISTWHCSFTPPHIVCKLSKPLGGEGWTGEMIKNTCSCRGSGSIPSTRIVAHNHL